MAGNGWVETVLRREPKIAVFDCDGTLWSGDAGAGFMGWSLENGLVPLRKADWLRDRYRAYEAGAVSEAAICGEMVQVYAGLPEMDLRSAAKTYVEQHVAPGIFPEMERLVGELRRTGAELWAVSSTCDWVVEAGVVKRFEIPVKRVLAAKARVEAGIVTDELLAVPTDEAKATALEQAGISRPDAVFGNSVHDLAMLRIARRAYPVNPSAALSSEAEARGWAVFYPTVLDYRPA